MLGVVLAILSSLSFSMNSVLSRRGVAAASASAGAFITVLMGVPMFFIAALATGQIFNAGRVDLNAYVLLSLAGILHFGVGRYFNYRAIGAIGATRASPLQGLATPYAILIAFVFLGETINVPMAIGIVLVLASPTIMVERTKPAAESRAPNPRGPAPSALVGAGEAQEIEREHSLAEPDPHATSRGQTREHSPAEHDPHATSPGQPPAFQLRQVDGYLSSMAAVLAYGTSPILIRAALQDTTDLAIYGGLVAYVAAALALIATLAHPKRRGLVRDLGLPAIRLFLGSGFFSFLAQLLRFAALAIAPVAVVNPLMRTGSIFTLVLSMTFNRHLEVINRRVVVGIFVSVAGVLLIVLNRAL